MIYYDRSGKSFAQYLRAALVGDLKSAGKFDDASPISVGAELTDNQLTTGISEGSALLAARFTVRKADQVVFDKPLRQESHWSSSFIGAIAIPDAFNHYTEQYSLLLNLLYADPDFKKACAPDPK